MIRLLRISAIAIAVAAFIDPPLTLTARGRPRIAVVTPTVVASEGVRAQMRSSLRADFDLVPGRDDAAAATVVVGDRYPDDTFPATARVFTVSTGPGGGETNTRIAAVRVAPVVPRGTVIPVVVDVEGSRAGASTSTLIVRSVAQGVELARSSHSWKPTEQRWRAGLDAIPLGPSPWRLRVELTALPAERRVDDNAVDVLVAEADPIRVLVHEARPSWASAFVRRALERDSRFAVASRSLPSRGVQITAGTSPPLQDGALDDVHVVIVGGLDRVTAAEAATLQRFMREREGLVVLLPDSRADAQRAAGWFGLADPRETLLDSPIRLTVPSSSPAFEASEIVTFPLGPGDDAFVRTADSTGVVAVVSARGGGRLFTSGALDAWRFRASDNAAFDRFWQSVIVGFGALVPPAIDARVIPAVLPPGGRASIVVRVRRTALMKRTDAPLQISATVGGNAVRLWPDAERDTFRGSFTAPRQEGSATVAISAVAGQPPAGIAGAARFIVSSEALPVSGPQAPLALLAQSHGGIDVTPDRIDDLVRALHAAVTAPSVRAERHPMRSVWWLLPFAACLSGEWWLRRRAGLR